MKNLTSSQSLQNKARSIVQESKILLAMAKEDVAFDKPSPLTFDIGDGDIEITIKEKC